MTIATCDWQLLNQKFFRHFDQRLFCSCALLQTIST